MPEVSWIWWVGLAVAVLLLLGLDLFVSSRGDRVPPHRVSVAWVGAYALISVAFAGVIWAAFGPGPAGQYLAGWLTEYSLSVDNVMVFLVLLARFAVPNAQRLRVLTAGIVIALIVRAALIAVGAAALERFSWLFVVFGLFLAWTAFGLVRGGHDDEPAETPRTVALVTRVLPATDRWHGHHYTVRENGRRVLTPLAVVVVVVGLTDVLFALDSIPAILGLTHDAYLVVAANAFALMGLRQLTFLVQGLLARVTFLNQGLAVILAFIAVGLVLEGLPEPWRYDIPTAVSLLVVVATLTLTVLLSAVHTRRQSIA